MKTNKESSVERFKPTPAQLQQLLEEVDCLCPLCGHRIMEEKKPGVIVKLYEIAHIYPHSATPEQREVLKNVPIAAEIESMDNVIVLCKNCHTKQDYHTSVKDYYKLYRIKKRVSAQREAKSDIANVDIEPTIKRIFEYLESATLDDVMELSYNPLCLNRKISDKFLLNDVRNNVAGYYSQIRHILQQIDNERSGASDIVAQQMKLAFVKAETHFIEDNASGGAKKTCFQEDVFNALVCWIASHTNSEETVCRIVVSYYIQNCEVFREITQ